jgi:hypothetical protein
VTHPLAPPRTPVQPPALYVSFTYGILYAQLAAFPVEFQEVRGWGMVVGELPFLAMLLGILVGAATNLLNQRYSVARFHRNHDRPVPEARLPPVMVGLGFFTIFQAALNYLVDAFRKCAASAVAANTFSEASLPPRSRYSSHRCCII